MAGRSRRSWLSVLLGLVLGFLLASRLILPRAAELQRAGRRRGGGGGQVGGCGLQAGQRTDYSGVLGWQQQQALPEAGDLSPGSEEDIPQDKNFLFVGVMTAKKYLETRAVAAYR
ncbi:hypothetical protein FKM82_019943 [Ascaphus truei]